MELPAQALMRAVPADLPAGRLFKVRDAWALRVSFGPEPSDQSFLILEGPRTGNVFDLRRATPPGLALAEPFQWFPVLDSADPAGEEGPRSAVVEITPQGPVIVGADANASHWDEELWAFSPDGARIEDYSHHSHYIRFDRWSVHVALPSQPFRSIGKLFGVDRRSEC